MLLDILHRINLCISGPAMNPSYVYFPSSIPPDVVPLPIDLFNISNTLISPSGFLSLPFTETVYFADVSDCLLFSEWCETLPVNLAL